MGDHYGRDLAHAYDEHSRRVNGDIEFYVALAREAGSAVELSVAEGA